MLVQNIFDKIRFMNYKTLIFKLFLLLTLTLLTSCYETKEFYTPIFDHETYQLTDDLTLRKISLYGEEPSFSFALFGYKNHYKKISNMEFGIWGVNGPIENIKDIGVNKVVITRNHFFGIYKKRFNSRRINGLIETDRYKTFKILFYDSIKKNKNLEVEIFYEIDGIEYSQVLKVKEIKRSSRTMTLLDTIMAH